MKTKIYKIFGVALALVLVFSLAGAFIPVNRAEAQAYTPNQWNTMDTPDPFPPFKIVTGSNITDIAVASDGKTIYAVDNTASLADGVKSIFGGGIWSPMPTLTTATNFTTGTAKLVAVAPDDPNVVAVVATGAVSDGVWYSTSGGATWAYMGETPGGATEIITDIAVSPTRLGPLLGRDIVVTTLDTGLGVFGDVYTVPGAIWTPAATTAGLVQFNFTSLALAPNWAGDRVVVAVGSENGMFAVDANDASAGGSNPGDTYLCLINVAPLDLSPPGAPTLVAPSPVLIEAAGRDSPPASGRFQLGAWNATVGTAAWSTTQSVSAPSSALLTRTNAGVGSVYVQFTPAGGYTIADLTALTNAMSYQYFLSATWGPQIELQFTDPAGTNSVEITVLVPQSAPTVGSWATATIATTSPTIWYSNQGSNATPQNLNLVEANINTVDSVTCGTWLLTRVRVELWDPMGASRTCYIDDITINGRTYTLEQETAETIVSSSIALPMDFDSTTVTGRRSFVGWTSTTPVSFADDAWRVDNLSVRKLEIAAQVSIYSVSYSGTISSGTLFAAETQGSAATAPALIWYSQDPQSAIPTWTYSFKPPTGALGSAAANVVVAAAPDFDTSLMVYAGTSGADSGFSRSPNGGISYNQIGLIDISGTVILHDVMPTPDSSVIFLATEDGAGNHSLWKSNTKPSGSSWERVRSKPSAGTNPFTTTETTIIRLSPEYDTDFTLYWCDAGTTSGGVIEKSVDGSDIFATRTAPVAIQDIAVESKDILYMGDDASTQVRRSTNGGWFFDLPIDAQVAGIYSLAMCPAYPEKPVAGNLAVGGISSSAMTKNSAASFFPLSASIGGGTNLQILADVDYANNNTVYAASNTAGHGIWRYEVGVSTAWEQIRPVGTTQQMTGLALQAGYLYGSWFDTIGVAVATGADSFTIIDSAGTGDTGNIVVTGGSVLVTPSGTATIAGGAITVPATIAAGASALWTTPAVGDSLLIQAATANSAGAWTLDAGDNAVAGITTDLDADASVWAGGAAGTGLFSLPDVVAVAAGVALGGAERSLVPAIPVIANWLFDTMDAGSAAATFSTVPSALRVGATETAATLWSINTTGAALLAYDDEMAKAKLALTIPDTVPIDPVSGRSSEFIISWGAISNATTFEVELHSDPACSQLVTESQTAGLATGWYTPSNPLAPAWVVRADTLVAGRDYFVRIRARDQMPADAIRSGWSSVYRFSVAGGERVQVTYLGPQPLGPAPGAINVPIDGPGFTWSPYAQSTRYEFQLATDSAFTDIVAETKTSATGYKYDGKLSNATTYFWRVRGIEPTTSDWSPVASFATEKVTTPPVVVEPAAPPPPAAPPIVTPAIIWAIIAIGAILVIAVIVLIVRTRRAA